MKILPNGIAVIENDLWISRWVEESGRLDHDQNLLPVILPYLKNGDYVVDGGAFIGDHTKAYLEAVGPTGKVFAFEPNPEAFKCLKHNCPEALLFNCGLFVVSHNSILELNRSGANEGATRLVVPSDKLGNVQALRLDSVAWPRLDFIKLDIEGMEMAALMGGENIIKQFKPIILLEINRHALELNGYKPKELIEYVENMGYRKKKVYESDSLEADQFDLLFFPD